MLTGYIVRDNAKKDFSVEREQLNVLRAILDKLEKDEFVFPNEWRAGFRALDLLDATFAFQRRTLQRR